MHKKTLFHHTKEGLSNDFVQEMTSCLAVPLVFSSLHVGLQHSTVTELHMSSISQAPQDFHHY